MTLGQAHNGLIRKREEPYRTLLRAKPKEKKSHLERFIVLGDADPRHVEERLGNELVSNQIMSHLNADGTRNDKAAGELQESEGSPDQAAVFNGANLQNPTIHISRNRKTSRLRASVHTLDSEDPKKTERRHRERNLTHGDIATMKQKLQQNRDKIYKINSLQRKLTHIRSKIDESNEADPEFKKLFVKSMIPMLTQDQKAAAE